MWGLPVLFEGKRHRGGYKAATGLVSPKLASEPMRPLTVIRPVDSVAKQQTYEPPGDLYVQFARTEPTETGVAEFASRYGLLGAAETAVNVDGTVVRGESLETWRGEIGLMGYALERWHLAQTARPGARRVLKKAEGRKQPLKEGEAALEWKWMEPALALNDAHEAVTQALGEGFKPTWVSDRKGRAQLCLVPRSLRTFMWLQLARDLNAGEVRQCAHCKSWIVAVPGTRGFRRTTCSNSCRVMASQKRAASARKRGARESHGQRRR